MGQTTEQASAPTVRRGSEATPFYFEERCYITEWLNDPADPAASVARAVVAPGVTTRWHRLQDITERYVVLDGEGEVEVGTDLKERVGPGDVVVIPPDTDQRIHNCHDHDLVFLAVCTPRFRAEAYQDTDPEPA